ncbi:MAG: 1-acyl-sn-glycerol-3-phosphate acyltransferase, partial [Cellvibrionaceae bacterium]|nr:1-acyl-sn-glycerol-3-phosphate acyltransferase [Cellvibrionaceae bacterium]
MLAMRAFLFYTGYSLSGIVFGALALLIMPLAYPRRAAILLQWNRFNVFWVRLCCGVKFEIKGNTQALDQACVILANHQSSWETVFLQAHFSPVATVLKQELLNIPFFGWGLKALAAIPIDRGNPRAAIKKIRQEGIERLQNGISVLVFPEGT